MTDGPRAVRHVFVYGTLLRGEEHGELLAHRGDLTYLGPARCRGVIHDLGGFPGLIPAGRLWVAGEVHRLAPASDPAEALGWIDSMESEAGFERRILPVRWRHGEVPAWVYVYTGPIGDGTAIPGGSWRAHLRRGRAKGGATA